MKRLFWVGILLINFGFLFGMEVLNPKQNTLEEYLVELNALKSELKDVIPQLCKLDSAYNNMRLEEQMQVFFKWIDALDSINAWAKDKKYEVIVPRSYSEMPGLKSDKPPKSTEGFTFSEQGPSLEHILIAMKDVISRAKDQIKYWESKNRISRLLLNLFDFRDLQPGFGFFELESDMRKILEAAQEINEDPIKEKIAAILEETEKSLAS